MTLRAYALEPHAYMLNEAMLDCYANGESDLIVEAVHPINGKDDLLRSAHLPTRMLGAAIALDAKANRKFIERVWQAQNEERRDLAAEDDSDEQRDRMMDRRVA